jgi:Lon protease-like protein
VPTRLPLFPLGTVLVPGLVLPLHIFEPRYRVLVQALMELPDGAPRHFGVVAIRAGEELGTDQLPRMFEIGCTAELREVTPHDDGRFDIVTVGHIRFRLRGLDDDAGTAYHTGLVDFLDEPDGEGNPEELAQRVAGRFAAYRDRLGVDQTPLPSDPRVLSYLVAAATVLGVPDRQALLEQSTTTDRLRAESELLRTETALIGTFRAVPMLDPPAGPVTPN